MFAAIFHPVMRISSTLVLKTCGPMDQAGLLPFHTGMVGPSARIPTGFVGLPAVAVAYKEVGGLATAFDPIKSRRAQSGGAFDEKSRLFAPACPSSHPASASRPYLADAIRMKTVYAFSGVDSFASWICAYRRTGHPCRRRRCAPRTARVGQRHQAKLQGGRRSRL
jgi:hypothetical protein